MVNYCCVYGCGRNNKVHKHLTFYSVPKAKDRQEKWLQAAGRKELIGKPTHRSIRLCSRHFEPSQIKKRNLAPEAVPTLFLPGTLIHDSRDDEPVMHNGLVCNSCSDSIIGFRYKCVTCDDYDLCQKCEMLEVHSEHLMLRINRPMKFASVEHMVRKWRDLVKTEQNDSDDDKGYLSSDDEPITKYARETDDGVDLADDIKMRIRKEIERVLKGRSKLDGIEKVTKNTSKKRPAEGSRPSKRLRKDKHGSDEKEEDSDDSHAVQELAFADVDDIKLHKMIKSESSAISVEPDKDICVAADTFI